MIWFTGDTHFGHKNVIRYANRPFSSVDEMDTTMIERWNAVVQPGDQVYHLGDVSFYRAARTMEILSALKGQIHLIRGNHDKSLDPATLRKFAWVKDVHTLKVPDEGAPGGIQRIVLMHYALRVWDKSHYGAWSLYGHSHGTLPDDPNACAIDVGVDCHEYTPVSYSRVREIMGKKTFVPVDHHGQDDA